MVRGREDKGRERGRGRRKGTRAPRRKGHREKTRGGEAARRDGVRLPIAVHASRAPRACSPCELRFSCCQCELRFSCCQCELRHTARLLVDSQLDRTVWARVDTCARAALFLVAAGTTASWFCPSRRRQRRSCCSGPTSLPTRPDMRRCRGSPSWKSMPRTSPPAASVRPPRFTTPLRPPATSCATSSATPRGRSPKVARHHPPAPPQPRPNPAPTPSQPRPNRPNPYQP